MIVQHGSIEQGELGRKLVRVCRFGLSQPTSVILDLSLFALL